MLDKLKDLCLLDGISGDEGAVREYIIDKIGDKAEIMVDNLGNVIAFCKGKKTPKNKIMVSAHMDEVGMIVTYVNSDGTLKVSSVGGIDPRVVFGRRVKIGYGPTQIARKLTEEGIQNPTAYAISQGRNPANKNSRLDRWCTETVNPFSGICFCADCGKKLYLCRSRSLSEDQ